VEALYRFFYAQLKAVLLHDGKKLPSVLFVHAVHMKETYASIQSLLKKKKLQKPPMEYMCKPES
jgi:hypothetical protein